METKPLTKVLIKLQNKAYFFSLIWSLEVWLASLSASEVDIPSLSLAAPSVGMTVLKALRSYLCLRNGCGNIQGCFLGSTGLFGWFLLARRRRVLKWYFWIWISSYGSHFGLSGRRDRDSDCRRIEHILCLPQLRWSLNPSSVKGFIPSLGAVYAAHHWDLCPKGDNLKNLR